MLRRLFIAAVTIALSPAAFAQTACSGGTVTDAAGEGFACDGIDLYARVTAQALFGADADCEFCLFDVWGWTDPATGREIGLVASPFGLAFVDVTEPEAPFSLGYVPELALDVKTHGDYAYIGQSFVGRIAIFDLRRLRGLAEDAARTFEPDAILPDLPYVHNVVVAEGAPLLAGVGGDACAGGYVLYDLTTPLAPALQGCHVVPDYTHDAQCLAYDGPDPDYVGRTVCFGFDADRVSIVDVTDPAEPVPLAEAFYPRVGLAHQGGLTEDRRYLLVDDEADESGLEATRTLVFDVADLDAPEYVGAYENPSTTASDHNLYIRGDYAYQANYTSGFRVLSLRGIAAAELEEVAWLDTYSGSDEIGLKGAWTAYPFFESGTVLVSDQKYGLFLTRVDPARLVDTPQPLQRNDLELSVQSPARGAAAVRLTAPAGAAVRLAVYDLLGRELAVAYDGAATGAEQTFAVGDGLPAGVVLVRAETAAGATIRSVVLVR